MTASLLSPGSPEYLTLFSDPAFLAEMEREFGPDFEAVLREHVQAEALRNTAPYASYISGQQENYSSHTQPAMQQPSTNANQHSSSLVSQPNQNVSENISPPFSTQQPQQSLKPMEGFGGGEETHPNSRSSQSISDRFNSILNKFMPQSNPKTTEGKNSESSRLLGSNYEEMSDEEQMGEEDSFLQCEQGVEMQSGIS